MFERKNSITGLEFYVEIVVGWLSLMPCKLENHPSTDPRKWKENGNP
jgi:hypothetical protein